MRSPGVPEARGIAAAAAALLSFSLPFLVATAAWPEVVAPAWAALHGSVLYRDTFFPHTPILPLLTAAAAGLLGFSAPVFRGLVGLSLASTALLLVIGLRPASRRRFAVAGLAAGVPALLLWAAYMEGPALWPDPWMAPLLLGGGLLLERFERAGRDRDLFAAGLLLGTAVLVKQTSAWASLAALAWLALRSRRRTARGLALLAAGIAVPYLSFAAAWGIAFRTVSHVRWTLLVPLQMALRGDNRVPFDAAAAHEALAPFLAIAACLLARAALPAPGRLRSALPWLAAGVVGMSYPRADLLHLSAAAGLLSMLLARSFSVLAVLLRRGRRRSPGPRRLAFLAAGAAVACVVSGVALLGGGALLSGKAGGPTRFWDDELTKRWEQVVRERARPGQELLLYGVPYDTLYAKTGTRMPDHLWANTYFWDCLNKEDADARLVASLARHPGLLVLYAEPELAPLRLTAVYRFLKERTEVVERLDGRTSWLRVASRASVR